MTQLITGTKLLISGDINLAILSEIVASLSYDNVLANATTTVRFTEEQYEAFLGDIGAPLIQAGILCEEFQPTYEINTKTPIV